MPLIAVSFKTNRLKFFPETVKLSKVITVQLRMQHHFMKIDFRPDGMLIFFSVEFFFTVFFNVYLLIFETERAGRGEAERIEERESQAGPA